MLGLRGIFSWRAAWQHIEPDCTFRHSLSYRGRAVLWFPYWCMAAVLQVAYATVLLPLGFLIRAIAP